VTLLGANGGRQVDHAARDLGPFEADHRRHPVRRQVDRRAWAETIVRSASRMCRKGGGIPGPDGEGEHHARRSNRRAPTSEYRGSGCRCSTCSGIRQFSKRARLDPVRGQLADGRGRPRPDGEARLLRSTSPSLGACARHRAGGVSASSRKIRRTTTVLLVEPKCAHGTVGSPTTATCSKPAVSCWRPSPRVVGNEAIAAAISAVMQKSVLTL